jgi:hypothetical protein
MTKYLTIEQIEELVRNNIYEIPKKKYQSRCSTGQISNDINMPALALPGGDVGEIAILYSASKQYGFECNLEMSVLLLNKIVGKGKSNENKHLQISIAEDCKYLHFLSEDPERYSLSKDMVSELFSHIEQAELLKTLLKKGNRGQVENACLIVQGNKGVLPQYLFENYSQNFAASVLIYHKSLINERRKAFIHSLYYHKAVKLPSNLDEEYLYEILSDVAEDHFYSYISQLDFNLPIYSVQILPNNQIKLESYS